MMAETNICSVIVHAGIFLKKICLIIQIENIGGIFCSLEAVSSIPVSGNVKIPHTRVQSKKQANCTNTNKIGKF